MDVSASDVALEAMGTPPDASRDRALNDTGTAQLPVDGGSSADVLGADTSAADLGGLVLVADAAPTPDVAQVDAVDAPVTPSTIECPSGSHNGGDGNCILLGACASGYHDDGTGNCVASGCAGGYHNGGGGICVPDLTCSAGFLIGPTGVCLPNNPGTPIIPNPVDASQASPDANSNDAGAAEVPTSSADAGCDDGGAPCLSPFVIERVPVDRGQTLHGVDNDTDGIRDDIEQVIADYGVSDPDAQHLLAFARALQEAIEVSPDAPESTILQLAEKLSRTLQCVLPSQRTNDYQRVREIQALSLNTRARVIAYFTNYERRIDGLSFQDIADPCN